MWLMLCWLKLVGSAWSHADVADMMGGEVRVNRFADDGQGGRWVGGAAPAVRRLVKYRP